MSKKYSEELAVKAVRAAGAEPLEPYSGNMSKKWACRCLSCDATIYPRLVNIDAGSRACRHCHGSQPVDHQLAVAAMHAAGVEPLESYPGFDKQWRVRCLRCGSQSMPTYNSIKKGQGGCFRCGTDYGELPAYVYLVHDHARKTVKVGITNEHAHRITKYAGWEVVEMIKLTSGREAAKAEAEVLKFWRVEMGLLPKLSRQEMRAKGYTETADDAGLDAAVKILRNYK